MDQIINIQDLTHTVHTYYRRLYDISEEYLSDAGKAAKDAYKDILWYLMFYGDFASLRENEEFMNLGSAPDKHPEYYKIMRHVYRIVTRG